MGLLRDEGWAISRPGKGTFVSTRSDLGHAYETITTDLERLIRQGHLTPGAQLPPRPLRRRPVYPNLAPGRARPAPRNGLETTRPRDAPAPPADRTSQRRAFARVQVRVHSSACVNAGTGAGDGEGRC